MNLSLMMGSGVATNQGFEESVTQRHELGAIAVSADGRMFRYAKSGASALVRGNVLQARVAEIAHDNVACRATALGATALLITTESGDGALDANEYSGGYAVIDTDPPAGQICKIDNHLAIAASTDGTINVVAEDGLIAALTTASKITLIKNPYDGVIQQPANPDWCGGWRLRPRDHSRLLRLDSDQGCRPCSHRRHPRCWLAVGRVGRHGGRDGHRSCGCRRRGLRRQHDRRSRRQDFAGSDQFPVRLRG